MRGRSPDSAHFDYIKPSHASIVNYCHVVLLIPIKDMKVAVSVKVRRIFIMFIMCDKCEHSYIISLYFFRISCCM